MRYGEPVRVGPPEDARYISTYRWLDLYGRARSVDIYLDDEVDRRVRVYATDNDGNAVLVAAVDENGKFTRLVREQAVTYGLDTAAAWNNLIELCRFANNHHSVY